MDLDAVRRAAACCDTTVDGRNKYTCKIIDLMHVATIRKWVDALPNETLRDMLMCYADVADTADYLPKAIRAPIKQIWSEHEQAETARIEARRQAKSLQRATELCQLAGPEFESLAPHLTVSFKVEDGTEPIDDLEDLDDIEYRVDFSVEIRDSGKKLVHVELVETWDTERDDGEVLFTWRDYDTFVYNITAPEIPEMDPRRTAKQWKHAVHAYLEQNTSLSDVADHRSDPGDWNSDDSDEPPAKRVCRE